MNVILKFDYYKRIVYIPDGYIKNLEKTHLQFFEWMYAQPEYRIYDEGDDEFGVEYDSDDFLRYLNEMVLAKSNEKAHYVTDKKFFLKRMPILKF